MPLEMNPMTPHNPAPTPTDLGLVGLKVVKLVLRQTMTGRFNHWSTI